MLVPDPGRWDGQLLVIHTDPENWFIPIPLCGNSSQRAKSRQKEERMEREKGRKGHFQGRIKASWDPRPNKECYEQVQENQTEFLVQTKRPVDLAQGLC